MTSAIENGVGKLSLGEKDGGGEARDKELEDLRKEIEKLKKDLHAADAERKYLRHASTIRDDREKYSRSSRSHDGSKRPKTEFAKTPGEAEPNKTEDPRIGRPKRILVIGGGPAGLITLHELLNPINRRAGESLDEYQICLYERRAEIGGVWYFEPENDVAKGWHHGEDARAVVEEDQETISNYPTASEMELLEWTRGWKDGLKPNGHVETNGSINGDYNPKLHEKINETDFCYFSSPQHAPRWPSPAYEGLVGNVLPPLLEFAAEPIPPPAGGLFPSMVETHNYLLSVGNPFRKFIQVNREVIDVRPEYSSSDTPFHRQAPKWIVTSRNWDDEAKGEQVEEEWDAIITAVGAFDHPYFPEHPGLAPLIKERSQLIMHAKSYPGPRPFVNRYNKIVVVGNANSANDIAAHLAPLNSGGPIYRCIRHESKFAHLPDNRIKDVAPIASMTRTADHERLNLVLQDGTKIDGVTKVIFASGYQYWFPWLKVPKISSTNNDGPNPDLENASKYGAVPHLHNSTFHAMAPTLCMIGLGQGSSPMPLAEIQARAAARVFYGTTALPVSNKPQDLLGDFYARSTELGLRDDDPEGWRQLHQIRGPPERKITANLIEFLENSEPGSTAGLFRWDEKREEVAKNLRAVKESELARLRNARVAAGGVDGGVGGILSVGPAPTFVSHPVPTKSADFFRGRAVGL